MSKCIAVAAFAMFFFASAQADVPRVATQLLSHHATAAQTGNGQSDSGVGISADGRFLIFRSLATDLVAGIVDDNAASDVFLYDRRSGRNELISQRHDDALRSASGNSYPIALSDDGRFVLFASEAPDIMPMIDGNGSSLSGRDLFLRDRDNGTVRLLTRKNSAPGLTSANAGLVNAVTMTEDGAFVGFMSGATDIIPGIANPMSRTQIYVYSRTDDSIQMLTTKAGDPAAASNSLNPSIQRISDDGQWWLLISDGSDLVGGVTSPIGWGNLFLFKRDGSTRLLLSRLGSNPNAGCAAYVRHADMNSDATRIVFDSECSAHISGVTDTNGVGDIFRFDRPANTITLLSHADGNTAQTANGASTSPKLDMNGNVVFNSTASNFVPAGVDENGESDVYLRTTEPTMELISVSAAAPVAGNGESFAARDPISDDGRYVTWIGDASDLDDEVTDDNAVRDVFVRDRVRGKTELVSVRGTLPLRSGGGLSALGTAMTADGTAFVFGSFATELSADHVDANNVPDAYVASFGALFSDGFE